MTTNWNRTLVACLLALTSLKINVNAQSPEQIKRIDSLMQAAHQIGTFNGNVLVAQKGKIYYQASIGYADGSKTVNLNSDLRFDIGSIAKEFNSTAILMLKEQGKLKLTDKVSTFLPDLPKWAGQIQIKHLLQYTSGLPNTRANSDEELAKELFLIEKLEFTPGTAFIYSYNNVYLQRRIVEKVSGLSYRNFVESFIFKPCHMNNAFVDDNTKGNLRVATAFDNNFVESTNTQLISGGVFITAYDLYQWTNCLNTYRLISKQSFEELAEGFPDSETSLGSTTFDKGTLIRHEHHGSNFNFEALMTSELTDDITIILLTNNQRFKVHALRTAILAILRGQPYTVPKKSLYLDLREKVLADFKTGITFYRTTKEKNQAQYDFSFEIGDLVNTGKYLMRRQRFDDAISLFQLSTLIKAQPSDLSFAYQLIAEAYKNKSNHDLAILYYQKAVETDSTNKNAQGFLDELIKHQ